jgi:hypothetical protein
MAPANTETPARVRDAAGTGHRAVRKSAAAISTGVRRLGQSLLMRTRTGKPRDRMKTNGHRSMSGAVERALAAAAVAAAATARAAAEVLTAIGAGVAAGKDPAAAGTAIAALATASAPGLAATGTRVSTMHRVGVTGDAAPCLSVCAPAVHPSGWSQGGGPPPRGGGLIFRCGAPPSVRLLRARATVELHRFVGPGALRASGRLQLDKTKHRAVRNSAHRRRLVSAGQGATVSLSWSLLLLQHRQDWIARAAESGVTRDFDLQPSAGRDRRCAAALASDQLFRDTSRGYNRLGGRIQ